MFKTLLVTYPHRLDEKGNPITRIRFVRSTATPKKKLGFNQWAQRIHKLNNH